MTPHYVFISPFESPLSYLFPVLFWGSSIICILISISFYRAKKGAWWLAVALTFAFPLIEGPVVSWHRGIPPFPFALQTVVNPHPAPPGFTGSKIIETKSEDRWDMLDPLMAIALTWGYVTEKKKRTQSPGS